MLLVASSRPRQILDQSMLSKSTLLQSISFFSGFLCWAGGACTLDLSESVRRLLLLFALLCSEPIDTDEDESLLFLLEDDESLELVMLLMETLETELEETVVLELEETVSVFAQSIVVSI